ncbi:uncharacterized protein LOC142175531 [Nicotiana tabacum]|uniref:Uncharacterized protein LOC142175531 n=1 Tax=Nicotiana tabacum TaxID=4097 RepID=A0AC58TMZ5_TOBAC
MANLDIDNSCHPLYLQPSNNPSNVIVSIQLKETENYSVWSKAMVIALRAKRKLGFIDGSFSPDLVNGIIYASDAHEVWVDLHDRFDKVNGSRIYNLQREIATISQGTSSISVYHYRLKSLWDEYNSMISSLHVTASTKDFIKHLEQQKLFQFLMGLNESYNTIRS